MHRDKHNIISGAKLRKMIKLIDIIQFKGQICFFTNLED